MVRGSDEAGACYHQRELGEDMPKSTFASATTGTSSPTRGSSGAHLRGSWLRCWMLGSRAPPRRDTCDRPRSRTGRAARTGRRTRRHVGGSAGSVTMSDGYALRGAQASSANPPAGGGFVGLLRVSRAPAAGHAGRWPELTCLISDDASKFFLSRSHREEGADEEIDGNRGISGFHFRHT